jgi:predicted lipoprotein with Yx(FWY)xxD motif
MMKTLLSAVIGAALIAGCATTATAPASTESGALVGPNRMTLYTYDRDSAGKSVCVDKCAVNWPPLMARASDSSSGDWQVITRPDGSKQWAYKNKPLYYWIKDSKPGDRTGDNVGNVWRLARP